jgi:hypothetical protein
MDRNAGGWRLETDETQDFKAPLGMSRLRHELGSNAGRRREGSNADSIKTVSGIECRFRTGAGYR